MSVVLELASVKFKHAKASHFVRVGGWEMFPNVCCTLYPWRQWRQMNQFIVGRRYSFYYQRDCEFTLHWLKHPNPVASRSSYQQNMVCVPRHDPICYETPAFILIHFSVVARRTAITCFGSSLFTTALPDTIMFAPACRDLGKDVRGDGNGARCVTPGR